MNVLYTAAPVGGCVLNMYSAAESIELNAGPTRPVGPAAADSALVRGAAVKLGADGAPTPGTVRTGAAGGFATALRGRRDRETLYLTTQ